MGTHFQNYESPNPRRLENRAREATSAAEDADRLSHTVMGQLVRALASDRDHAALVKAAGVAVKVDDFAGLALAAARKAATALHSRDAEQLDAAADEAQAHAADARVAGDHALHLIPLA
jgi:hypothetical protein